MTSTPNNPTPAIVEALKAAVKPFAELCAQVDDLAEETGDLARQDRLATWVEDLGWVLWGDFRNARAALLRAEGESREEEPINPNLIQRAIHYRGNLRDGGLIGQADIITDLLAALGHEAQPHHPTASVDLITALTQAAEWFRESATEHYKKGTPEGTAKAERNVERMQACKRAIVAHGSLPTISDERLYPPGVEIAPRLPAASVEAGARIILDGFDFEDPRLQPTLNT